MSSYLDTAKKSECCGCGACYQVCPVNAITMIEDEEGFRYPVINEKTCIHCNKCRRVCPIDTHEKFEDEHMAWGGYNKDNSIREKSTSGGAFTAIAEYWLEQENAVVYGAELVEPTKIVHSCVSKKEDLERHRKSKYIQSDVGNTFVEVLDAIKNGKKVLYSGTPCQIAGLKNVLGKYSEDENLLLVEVVCEGVPSPLYIKKYIKYLENKYKKKVKVYDWRYKNKNKWDFEFTKVEFNDGSNYKLSRWFNPFWSVWLKHLMSRPSCYECPFTTSERCADITIADLWGVHIYCPELYGKNKGASLVIANSSKGKKYWSMIEDRMYGHELKFEDAIKYQGPMRKHIPYNELREECMSDLKNDEVSYKQICKKWASKPSPKLLFQKYIYGNRQKVAIWNLKNKLKGNGGA